MVRRIVGTLVEAGRGNITDPEIEGLLNNMGKISALKSFNPAEYTAPPSGLFLEKVEY
jgi:tRNA pseudouridine38-40 synthase